MMRWCIQMILKGFFFIACFDVRLLKTLVSCSIVSSMWILGMSDLSSLILNFISFAFIVVFVRFILTKRCLVHPSPVVSVTYIVVVLQRQYHCQWDKSSDHFPDFLVKDFHWLRNCFVRSFSVYSSEGIVVQRRYLYKSRVQMTAFYILRISSFSLPLSLSTIFVLIALYCFELCFVEHNFSTWRIL